MKYPAKRRAGLLVILAITALVFSGCQRGDPLSRRPAQGAEAATKLDSTQGASDWLFEDRVYTDAQVVTLKMPTSPTAFHVGMNVNADKYGFYRREGIAIEYVNVPPGSGPMLAALKKGDIDMFTGHPDAWLNAYKGGVRLRAVLAGSKGHPDFPHDTAWVPKDSPIREPKDVIGKKVGGITTAGFDQGCMSFYWAQFFRIHGISPSQLTNAVVPPNQQEQALQQGIIDIMTVHPPQTGVVERSGKYRRLWQSWEITDGDVIDKQDAEISLYGFTEDFVASRPEVVKRYVRAAVKSEAFTVDFQELYTDWIQEKIGWLPPVREGGDHNNHSSGLIRESAVQKWIDWKVYTKELTVGQIKPRDLFTNEFNPFSIYKPNDPKANPTFWDNPPKEFGYLAPTRKQGGL